MNRKFLLTGATGFIGKKVLKALLDNGCSVTAVVRNGSEKKITGKYCPDKVITSSNIFREGVDWWARACKDIDTVIHLAWYTEHGKYLESTRNIECFNGTLRIANGAIMANIKKFIGIGTCLEYKFDSLPVGAHSKLDPISLYAQMKAKTYIRLTELFLETNISFGWYRLFYLHGDGENEGRLFQYLNNAFSNRAPVYIKNGNSVRDYIDVEFAANLIVTNSFLDQVGPINICSGIGKTIKEICEEIADRHNARHLLNFVNHQKKDSLTPRYMVGEI